MVSLLISLVIIGFVGYLIQLIPMAEPIRKAVVAILVLVAILWLLQSLGLIAGPFVLPRFR